MFLWDSDIKALKSKEDKIEKLMEALDTAECVLIGAGAGLSASAGFTYTGERFQKYFRDFIDKYNFPDMYSGGFYPFDTLEEHWAYWSRYIYINRYMDAPAPVYDDLFQLIKNKDYFVLTTNVDHCFQKAGFDRQRLFYTQGDFGLFQCSVPCRKETYDNEEVIRQMMREQKDMAVPSELLPVCPHCGRPMTMNLRADERFVEDQGWKEASARYTSFMKEHRDKRILFLELGVGYNTPGIIKYPFWRMTLKNPRAVYVCVNYGQAIYPEKTGRQSVCIDGDIREILGEILDKRKVKIEKEYLANVFNRNDVC